MLITGLQVHDNLVVLLMIIMTNINLSTVIGIIVFLSQLVLEYHLAVDVVLVGIESVAMELVLVRYDHFN